jgi:methionyl-tRNA synthetase
MGVFYLTTPIYYVNAPPHLGHAYTTIVGDAMARWHRLVGDRVFFLTGTDEHGDKIAQAAAAAGISPQALADRNSAAFRQAWKRLGIVYDDYIRTTEPRHTAVVQHILQRLHDAGEFYLGKYGGQYCFGCERFYTDKEVADGLCPDHRTPLTYIEEENYFFRMSAYQDWLAAYLKAHPDLILPERYRNEILGFLGERLHDLSISRPKSRLQWGIPLPFDDRFVTYVWFDALINYVSALDYPDGERFRTFWPHAQHLIGKDILKPHAVYWPCMLKALARAQGLPEDRSDALLFRHLNVHGYWNIGGGKMSKSVGNVVEALALREKYGNDAFRYFVMREMVFGLDADFSEEAFVGRLNADLANDLGNLVARATTLIASHGGITRVPATTELDRQELAIRQSVEELVQRAGPHSLHEAMDAFAFHRALGRVWNVIALLNGYVDVSKPWGLARDPAARPHLERVLYVLGESLRILGIVLAPFLPDAAVRIRQALGQTAEPQLAHAAWGGLQPGAPVRKLSGLFPRVDQRATATAGVAADRPVETLDRASAKDGESAGPITKDQFARLDLRVAQVLAAEPVAKSRKLLKLTVSLGGDESRTVVAGIAEHYRPDELVGKKVVIVANLEPARLMGIESQGMLLAGSAQGQLSILVLDRDLPPGARVT